MNPYLFVISAVQGRSRRCPACGKQQVIGHVQKEGRYHCKKCGHKFTKDELRSPSGRKHSR